MMGGEFIWGRRENFFDGFTANDFRIQFSFKYNFAKKSFKFSSRGAEMDQAGPFEGEKS